ncbi:MAG: nucleoside 2-deoxyribosyltransferase [Candidatus Woesearchaeota archaeon]
MKIFFSGSIRGGRNDVDIYREIVDYLKTKGELFGEFNADKTLEEKEKKEKTSDNEIHKNDVRLIKQCDILVAEVSTPSIGVGYEIGIAESLKKTILCLFREGVGARLSAMINGNDKITVIRYTTVEELKEELKDFFDG